MSASTQDLCRCMIRQDESGPLRCVKIIGNMQESRNEARPSTWLLGCSRLVCFCCYNWNKLSRNLPFPEEDFTLLVSKLNLTRPCREIGAVFKDWVVVTSINNRCKEVKTTTENKGKWFFINNQVDFYIVGCGLELWKFTQCGDTEHLSW